MFRQDASGERDQDVSVRDTDVVGALDVGDVAFAIFVQWAGVYVASDEEVGDGGPALRGAFGHDAAKGSGDFEVAFGGRRCGGLNVGGENLSVGAGAADGGDIDA